jgi:hypothetical protein
MGDDDREPGLGLADFISALRVELGEAQRRAAEGVEEPLKLAVDQIELELDIAYKTAKAGEVSAGVRAKFWVLEFGEAGAKGTVSAERVRTQHLKMTLTPSLETTAIDEAGKQNTTTTALKVGGELAAGEQ